MKPTRREDLPARRRVPDEATQADWDRWLELHLAAHRLPTAP